MSDYSHCIARTGRVQSWMDNPDSRLPVSCTVFNVEDSMEGDNGIEASWRFVSHGLRNGAGVAVHLSQLRPKGTVTAKGSDQLVASGPCSFARIYSMLNETLRRGGTYRNGAVVIHLDLCHADALEFVQMPRADLPWAKRCIDLTPTMWAAATAQLKSAVLEGIAKGDIWLAKIRFDQHGERIFANVCLEIFIKSRGTCLLEHINLGACTINDLRPAFEHGMKELVALHGRTGVGDTGEYLPPEQDKQVGLGLLGLANLLNIQGITYGEFADALEEQKGATPAAIMLVAALRAGYQSAAKIARSAGMDRAFTIAPTASCSYRYQDRAGFTTTPEIAPPIGRIVDRDSGTLGVTQVNYGNVETCDEVGWDNYKRVADGIMQLMAETGLSHGYSYNSWSDKVTYNEAFIEDWLNSPQTSLYYSLQVSENMQAKDDATEGLGEADYSFGDEVSNDDTLLQMFYDSGCVGCAE